MYKAQRKDQRLDAKQSATEFLTVFYYVFLRPFPPREGIPLSPRRPEKVVCMQVFDVGYIREILHSKVYLSLWT